LKYLSILFLLIACPVHAETFKVVVYGDTHDTVAGAPILSGHNDWIISQAEALNIKYVLHLGDGVTDPADNEMIATEMQRLATANIPYIFSLGNHEFDTDDSASPARATTSFDTYYPVADFSWVDGNFDIMQNSYDVITVGGVEYLFMTIAYCPDDDAIAWADGILTANTDKHVIISTHYYFSSLTSEYSRGTNNDNYTWACQNNGSGEALYQNVFINYPNILMILAGHNWNPYSTYVDGSIIRRDVVDGVTINQIRQNWQADTRGNLYIRIYTIDTEADAIQVQSYSPSTDTYLLNSEDNFYLNKASIGFANIECEGIIIQ